MQPPVKLAIGGGRVCPGCSQDGRNDAGPAACAVPAPTAGKLHQTSPQPNTPLSSSTRTRQRRGRSCHPAAEGGVAPGVGQAAGRGRNNRCAQSIMRSGAVVRRQYTVSRHLLSGCGGVRHQTAIGALIAGCGRSLPG